MKKLNITITLGMEVPDHWVVVKAEDGIDVIDLGDGRYLDLTFTPMMTDDHLESEEWTNDYIYDYRFADSIVDMVTEYEAIIKMLTAH
jgi:hypothetical protein